MRHPACADPVLLVLVTQIPRKSCTRSERQSVDARLTIFTIIPETFVHGHRAKVISQLVPQFGPSSESSHTPTATARWRSNFHHKQASCGQSETRCRFSCIYPWRRGHVRKICLHNRHPVNLGHAIAAIRHLLHAITTSNSLDVDRRQGGLWNGNFDFTWRGPPVRARRAASKGMQVVQPVSRSLEADAQ